MVPDALSLFWNLIRHFPIRFGWGSRFLRASVFQKSTSVRETSFCGQKEAVSQKTTAFGGLAKVMPRYDKPLETSTHLLLLSRYTDPELVKGSPSSGNCKILLTARRLKLNHFSFSGSAKSRTKTFGIRKKLDWPEPSWNSIYCMGQRSNLDLYI